MAGISSSSVSSCCTRSLAMRALVVILARGPVPAVSQRCLQPNKGSQCADSSSLPCCSIAKWWGTGWQSRFSEFSDVLVRQIAHGLPFSNSSSDTIATCPFWSGDMRIAVRVYQLFAIDQKSQSFQIKYKVRSRWRDCRTLHNCTSLLVSEDHPEFKNIWTPSFDIEEARGSDSDMERKSIEIDPDGLISFESHHVSTVGCKFNLEDYPFDVQKCKLTFAVAQLPRLKLGWDPKHGVIQKISTSGEWEVSEWKTSTVNLPLPMGTFVNSQVAVRIEFTLSRVSSVAIRSYALPVISFWFASWIGLWIDCTAVPARAAMGIVPLLILVNKMNALSASLPPTSTTNILERYMLAVLGLLCLHLLEFAVVNYSMRRERDLKSSKSDEEAGPEAQKPAKPHSSRMCSAMRSIDQFATRHLAKSLNVHTRWVSAVIFIIVTAVLLR